MAGDLWLVYPRLDPVASGWPLYLRVMSAIAILIKEADKTDYQTDYYIVGATRHHWPLTGPGAKWLSTSQMLHYQRLYMTIPE